MEDFTQFDAGKRKRSPADNLVNVTIPFLYNDSNQPPDALSDSPNETLPLSKRARLPEKPPVPDTGSLCTSSLMSLPPGILQTIFSYLDPPSLGRLIRVNRTCRDLLDSRRPLPPDQTVPFSLNGRHYEKNLAPLRRQDIAWQISRRRDAPSMPRPMDGVNEREQFALSFGITCQFCGAFPVPVKAHSTSRSSPIEYSVRVMWPFKVRSCVSCLSPLLKKDSEVMMSDASPLRPALSFAFFTSSLQYVPQSRWREFASRDIDLQKYHYAPDIEVLQQEARTVQALGPAAAEEWIKGLPLRGQSVQSSATQWEDWELNGGLEKTRQSLFQHTAVPERSFPLNEADASLASFSLPGISVLPMPRPSALSLMPLPNMLPALPLQSHGLAPGMEAPPRLPLKPSDASSMGSQTSSATMKTAPSHSERVRIRAYKQGQIVERCRVLNPPIHKDMLERLDAYYNALQIPMPLNDNSWEILKSLLLTQRKQIDLQDEARNSVTTAPVPGQFVAPSRTDEYVLAHADIPTKDKLCEIAKEYIKQRFGHGGWVTYPSAPQFAAEVLTHTREQYFEEQARIKALRSHDLNAPSDEMLRYEHMKWVFDQTIRPQTEQIRKDLFLCARCPSVGAGKYFAFESIIQHFAYKHDPNFTSEAPKAFWKCEWPEVPPFNVHPERIRTPEPSIMRTPTLFHQTPSIMSPGSNLQTMIPPGRRTPDTMSLLSGNTNLFSASGRSARKPSQTNNPVAPVIYELQRDSLAIELSRGWKLAASAPPMPLSLQLHLALGFAVASFSRNYKNEPSLTMLEDCISAKNELRELKNLEPLRCAECVLDGRDEVQVEWSLQDLTAHFRKMHVENAATKAYWKDSMISLPAPTFIKRLLLNDEIPTVLQNLLQDAETTAAIQKATAYPPKSYPIPQSEPVRGLQRTQNSLAGLSTSSLVDGRDVIQSFDQPEDQTSHSRVMPFSVVAPYVDPSSSRNTWPTSLQAVRAGDHPGLASNQPRISSRAGLPSYPTAALYSDRSAPLTETHSFPANRRFVEPRGEVMSRSETIHSHRSRGEDAPCNTADDFLSAIDAHLDVEMAGSEPGDSRSSHLSQPVSRTNSARGPGSRVSHRTALNHGDEGQHRHLSESNAIIRYQQAQPIARRNEYSNSANLADESDPPVMERQRSRVIEFDHQGNPVSTDGQVYQEPPPLRSSVYRQYVDEFGRPVEPPSPIYGRRSGFPIRTGAGMDYMEDHRSRRPYAPLEHGPAQVYQPERVIDSVTGQVFIVERPVMRQFDDTGGPQTLYDGMGRHVRYEYREVDYDAHGADSPRYDGQPTGYQDRRYQGR